MSICVTGSPGAGKTLNTIKMLISEDRFLNYTCPDTGRKLPRPVKYCTIELTDEGKQDPRFKHWEQVTHEEIKQWWDFPPGTIVLVDEAHQIFPQTKLTADMPEHIKKLDMHRHLGIDFILITQWPTNLSKFARKMMSHHYHFARKFNMPAAVRREFTRVVDDPDEKNKFEAVASPTVPYDKKLFNLYHSTSLNTRKTKLPFKVYAKFGAIIFSVCAVGFGIVSVLDSLDPESRFDDAPIASPASDRSMPDGSTALRINQGTTALTKTDYIAQQQPRVPDLPWTAPVYDQVREVKTYPRVAACMLNHSTSKCDCYSQQATKLDISYKACLGYLKGRPFDYAKPDANHAGSPTGARGVTPQ